MSVSVVAKNKDDRWRFINVKNKINNNLLINPHGYSVQNNGATIYKRVWLVNQLISDLTTVVMLPCHPECLNNRAVYGTDSRVKSWALLGITFKFRVTHILSAISSVYPRHIQADLSLQQERIISIKLLFLQGDGNIRIIICIYIYSYNVYFNAVCFEEHSWVFSHMVWYFRTSILFFFLFLMLFISVLSTYWPIYLPGSL